MLLHVVLQQVREPPQVRQGGLRGEHAERRRQLRPLAPDEPRVAARDDARDGGLSHVLHLRELPLGALRPGGVQVPEDLLGVMYFH